MATVYLKPSTFTDLYGGFPNIVSFGGEWDGSDVGGRNPDWLIGMRASYNGKIYEALTNHDGDVNSPPNTNTTDWREVSGTLDDPYKATDLIQSNFLLDSLTDGDEVILTDGLYDYLPFSSTVYPQNGRPTLRALNDYEAIIGQSSFKPANILCVGLDVRSPAVSGYTNYPDGGRVGFNYHRCILTSGYWWPPANSVVTNCLIKQTNVLFYAAFGQATNSASTDKAIQMLNNTVILTSNTGQPLLNTLINQGLMNPVFKNNIFYIKSHTGSTSLAPSNWFYQGTWENNVFFDTSGQVVDNTGNLINIEPSFVDPLGSSFRDFQLRPSSSLIGGITTTHPLNEEYPDGLWVDSAHTEINASYSFSLDTGDGSNYTFSGDATGTDPSINANIRDTLVFTNTTGGHALAIYNSQGIQVASEASGTTTFSPKYPDTYYYQCTVPGHENMRGDIVVTLGTLGSYEHPFESYHDAIDSGYYNSKMILLFKEGDHLMSWYPGTNYTTDPGISSSFPGGLSFVGEDAETTRFTTGNNFNTYSAFFVASFTGSAQSQTPLTIEGMGFHINNTSSYINRGMFSGVHWKSFTLKHSKVTCDLGGAINSGLFDYFSEIAPAGYEFNLSGCEMNAPLSDNNGPGGSFLSGDTDIKYTVNSCSFTKLDGYNYVGSDPSPIMVGAPFSSSNGSKIKDCIFYSNAGGNFGSSSVMASGVFSSCIFYSATDSFTNLPPDMDVNSAADPLFIDTLAGSEDLRLRPDSSAIGGIFKSKYPADTIWVQSGTGSGTGTEGDPFYWSEYSEAFLAAAQSSSNQIVFKDGEYVWTSAILQDDNVGNNITMIAENTHQAIFTDAGRISSATKYPTLRFKGIQLVADDHFTWQPECHYIFDSVHVLAGKYIGARSVTASGCIFEVPSGVNAYMFSSTGLVDITNCIFVDHNDRTSGVNYLTGATTGTIKNTIFYTKNPRTYCINPSHNAVLTNCASENITNPEDGVVFNENLGFLDIDNKNYKLRPSSVLIGRGK